MTRNEILLNFFNLENPTKKQIVEVIKILIKDRLKITDDLYFINSLTGERTKKINTTPTQIDPITDESIMINIAKVESKKVKTELSTLIKDEITKQLNIGSDVK